MGPSLLDMVKIKNRAIFHVNQQRERKKEEHDNSCALRHQGDEHWSQLGLFGKVSLRWIDTRNSQTRLKKGREAFGLTTENNREKGQAEATWFLSCDGGPLPYHYG